MRTLHLCRLGATLMLAGMSAGIVTGCDSQNQTVPTEQAQQEETMAAKLVGSASYRERIALPPGAELVISLEDVSKADAASETVASLSQTLTTAPPYEFELSYEPAKLKPKARYSLRGQIYMADQLLFTTTQAYQPFGVPRIEMLLEKVGGKRAAVDAPEVAVDEPTESPAASAVDISAVIGDWTLLSLNGDVLANTAEESNLKLTLMTSGSASGFSGCNHFRGDYVISTEGEGRPTLSFGPIAGTRKMCQRIMEVESAMLTMLSQSKYFTVTKHQLNLLNGDEVEIATLVRGQ
ncbi:META domain-containing protein [Corallincola holothuriorum]|uniref:META domain-containing protein n=1 Tax=Corallincola holothuriorum TaxID=2282215 RepID=A0A368NG91_9GAMM|nr:YbaY family lipoprotein [Corallincola holothuriorum]RCU49592.1 META domain-containing protein [Corallincola holothuriorum]